MRAGPADVTTQAIRQIMPPSVQPPIILRFNASSVPIVQLSLDETQPPAFHFEVGERLAPLRDEGVLVVGSGNLVHNLHAYGWGRRSVAPYDWALRFEEKARELIHRGEHGPLIAYESLGADAVLSVPTPS